MKNKDTVMRWLLTGAVATAAAGYVAPKAADACYRCRKFSGTGCIVVVSGAGQTECDDVNTPCRLHGDGCGGIPGVRPFGHGGGIFFARRVAPRVPALLARTMPVRRPTFPLLESPC